MNRVKRALVLVCLLLAPASFAQPTQRAPQKPATSDGGAPATTPQDLLKTADELVKQVASLRQLPARGPVKRGVLSREQLKQKLREQIARQYTPAEIQLEAKVLEALGLIPPGTEYEKLLMDLLMEQVAGFYDAYGKQLYIADWLAPSMQAPALAHEITHALQDQHFDLKRFVQPVHDQGDRQLARMALVEGDGTGVMLEFVGHMDLSAMPDMAQLMDAMGDGSTLFGAAAGSMPVLQKAPEFIRRSLLFPYASGLGFVQYVRKRYPWSKIDEAYKHPPESTEQILHPEKFFAKEHPVWIKSAPLSALKGQKAVHEDTIGEMQIRLWLSIVGGAKNASDAAAGWAGDRLVAYERPGEPGYALVWLTQWDTEADAAEFAKAAEPAAKKLGGVSSGVRLGPTGKADGAPRVVILLGVAPELADKVTNEVLASWRPGKAPAN
jgi:hypothetical protein